MLDLETRQPLQLPIAVAAPADAVVVIQAPAGPVQQLRIDRLLKGGRPDVVYETRADLDGDLDFQSGAIALVYADPNLGNHGWWIKQGSVGSGSWSQLSSSLSAFLQSGSGAIARPLQGKLLEMPVSPEDFGAVGGLVVNDSAAWQLALDTGRPIMCLFRRKYRINTGLQAKVAGQIIYGNQAELHFYGADEGLDFIPSTGDVWLTNCSFNDFTVYVHTAGAIGIRWRASYSFASNVSVVLYASDQVAWLIDVDATNGTGCYYNSYYNCHVQGRSFLDGFSNQRGWLLNSYLSAPTRAPNSNTWYSGRTSGCDVNYNVRGCNNVFYSPTSETVPPGGWHFRFENPYGGAVGCIGNAVIKAYVEGQEGSNGFYIDVNAVATCVENPYITTIGGGVSFEDHGSATYFSSDAGLRLPNIGSLDPRTLDWYEEGEFTPNLTFNAPGDLAVVYGPSNSARFTRIGRTVGFDLDLQTTTLTFTTSDGNLFVGTLPFQATGAPIANLIVGSITGLSLTAGQNFISAQIEPGSQRLYLSQNGNVNGPTTMGVSNALSGRQIRLQISGTYTVVE